MHSRKRRCATGLVVLLTFQTLLSRFLAPVSASAAGSTFPGSSQQESHLCIASEGGCYADLRYFASRSAGAPATDIQRLLAVSIGDLCGSLAQPNITTAGAGCPALDWAPSIRARLLRNLVYCPGSLLDQAITCLETTSGTNCSANAACTWTNRTFVARFNASRAESSSSSNNDNSAADQLAATILMTAVDNAIAYSLGWLKSAASDISDSSDAGVLPFNYCAARWTVNESQLISLYRSFGGWQKDALDEFLQKQYFYFDVAVPLLGPAGHAITGSCRAGRTLTSWASTCTNRTTKSSCSITSSRQRPQSAQQQQQQQDPVTCTWSSDYEVCMPYSMVVQNILFREQLNDQWVVLLQNLTESCSGSPSFSSLSSPSSSSSSSSSAASAASPSAAAAYLLSGSADVTKAVCTARGPLLMFDPERLEAFRVATPPPSWYTAAAGGLSTSPATNGSLQDPAATGAQQQQVSPSSSSATSVRLIIQPSGAPTAASTAAAAAWLWLVLRMAGAAMAAVAGARMVAMTSSV